MQTPVHGDAPPPPSPQPRRGARAARARAPRGPSPPRPAPPGAAHEPGRGKGRGLRSASRRVEVGPHWQTSDVTAPATAAATGLDLAVRRGLPRSGGAGGLVSRRRRLPFRSHFPPPPSRPADRGG